MPTPIHRAAYEVLTAWAGAGALAAWARGMAQAAAISKGMSFKCFKCFIINPCEKINDAKISLPRDALMTAHLLIWHAVTIAAEAEDRFPCLQLLQQQSGRHFLAFVAQHFVDQ